jgi:hypothetical protein
MSPCHVGTRTGTLIGTRVVLSSAVKLSLFVLAAWLSAAPAFAQSHKGANFGGVPTKLLNQITGAFSGTLPAGITPQDASNVLLSLIREEHAAANPGSDFTGVMDALMAFDELRTAFANVQKATPVDPKQITILIQKIDALGKLWTVGPVLPGFFGPEN